MHFSLSYPSPFLSHHPPISPYTHSVALISCVSVPNLSVCVRACSDAAYVKKKKKRGIEMLCAAAATTHTLTALHPHSHNDTHTHARWDYIKARWWKPSSDAPMSNLIQDSWLTHTHTHTQGEKAGLCVWLCRAMKKNRGGVEEQE